MLIIGVTASDRGHRFRSGSPLQIGVTAYELPTRRGGREAAVNKQIVFKSLSLLSSDSSHGQSKKPLLSSTLYSALAAVSFLLYTTSCSLRFVFPNTISSTSLLVNTYGILLTNTSVLQPRNCGLSWKISSVSFRFNFRFTMT